jgi:hypothetical protein
VTLGLRTIIGIEKSAAKALRASIEPAVIKLGDQVKAAVKAGDTQKALHLVGHFDITQHVNKITPALEELAMSAAIFGASQTQEPHKTLFVQGKGHRLVFKAARQMQSIATKMANERIREHARLAITAKDKSSLRSVARKSFEIGCCPEHTIVKRLLLKADTVIPADQQDISDALNAATLGNGRLAADVGANLTTTRLASYGFLAQAAADGHTRYQITAELDDRTCPVCMYMHGKSLDVGRALDQTEEALSADNPDDLSDIAPWPGQSRADLQDMLQMDPEELQAAGYMVPPFHPACRCVLQDDGTVAETLSPETPTQAEDTTSGDNWFTKLLDLLTGNGANDSGAGEIPIEDL